MDVALFDYPLPADRIAQRAGPRGASRLLVLERAAGRLIHGKFSDLPEWLDPGDLLVRNDTRVVPVRLLGVSANGKPVEIFLTRYVAGELQEALARPGRRARPGARLVFDGLEATVESVRPDGRRMVLFDRPLQPELLERIGHVPLPPYIRRPDEKQDRERYQTVFARRPGAVAAPTAGLHFTEEIFERLRARGIRVADLTLAIGPGTFKPVAAGRAEDHVMEPEEVEIPQATVEAIGDCHRRGRRVVAVGTTVTRALEAWARINADAGTRNAVQEAGSQENFGRVPVPGPEGPRAALNFSTDLFILPGFEFRVVDALLTNFHLPRSTLLMLVCAFASREQVLQAYAQAVREGYLFYSYGDAMLIC
jgi:S-adenosylmethionine:tRNA ribosyltransferase-isomerase